MDPYLFLFCLGVFCMQKVGVNELELIERIFL